VRKIKMAKNKNVEISLEEKLRQALVPVDEQPYTIPSNWVWTRLGEVISIFRGLSYTKNNEVENGYLVLRGNNLTDSGLSFLENIYVDEKIAVKGVKVKKDDIILVASTGSSKVIGRACVAKKDYEKTTIGAFLLLCRPKENIIKSWVHYIFKTLRYRLYISEQAKGTNIKNIKNEYLENFYFPLPPLNEQKRIVEKLDFLFEKTKRAKEIIEEIKIDIENRKISILDRTFKGTLTSKWRNENKTSDVKELLKSINEEKIKKWEEDCLQAEKDGNKKPKKPTITEVKDMIVPVDEQPYKLPDSWVWVRLGDIVEINPNKIKINIDENELVDFIPMKNVSENSPEIIENNFEKFKNLQKGYSQFIENDILFAKITPCMENGKIAIVSNLKEKIGYGSTEFHVLRSTKIISNKLLYNFLKQQRFREDAKYNMTGSVGFRRVPTEFMRSYPFPLPPLEEQQEIVRVLDEVLENENKVKELLELEERIDILEKSILHKAFKGELGTQNSSDESALELLKEIL
jgi:hypothetical protein